MSNPTEPYDNDMPAEIAFSQGKRGPFYQPQTRLNLPVYLEAKVETYLAARAKARASTLANLSTSC